MALGSKDTSRSMKSKSAALLVLPYWEAVTGGWLRAPSGQLRESHRLDESSEAGSTWVMSPSPGLPPSLKLWRTGRSTLFFPPRRKSGRAEPKLAERRLAISSTQPIIQVSRLMPACVLPAGLRRGSPRSRRVSCWCNITDSTGWPCRAVAREPSEGWRGGRGSNPQPSVSKTDALSIELPPRKGLPALQANRKGARPSRLGCHCDSMRITKMVRPSSVEAMRGAPSPPPVRRFQTRWSLPLPGRPGTLRPRHARAVRRSARRHRV